MLIAGGSAAIFLAVGWWWLSYRDIIGQGCITGHEAGYCVVGETEVCARARALCGRHHPPGITYHASIGLWLGMLALCTGLVLDGWKRVDEGEDDGIIQPHLWF